MTNEEILKFEYNRSKENLNTIYLVRDNNDWYKAYEWSAYLLEFYPKSLSDKKLNPTKKYYTGIKQELIWVSLKNTSFEKFIPEAQYLKDIKDDLIPVIVDLSSYPANNPNMSFLDILKEWKNTVTIKETTSKQQPPQQNQVQKVYTAHEIEQLILNFQYYNLEKEDLIKFIQQLKNMCATRI